MNNAEKLYALSLVKIRQFIEQNKQTNTVHIALKLVAINCPNFSLVLHTETGDFGLQVCYQNVSV